MKSKLKFLFIIFLLFILLTSSFCFATNEKENAIPTSNVNIESNENNDIRNSDLFVGDKQYEIKNTIKGNVFAATDTLNINPSDNGGIIEGNLFASANIVDIKSNVTYSETEKDDIGNYAINIDNFSKISGNAFVVAKKFILEPGCKIYGDLYICANEVELAQNSIIYGNVFVVANKLYLNSEIGETLHATVKDFNMDYYGFINRDLYLTTENGNLNGYIYRNSFVTAKNLTTDDMFINQEDFNVHDADNFTFSGEVKGNANINCKNFKLKDDNGIKGIISGNLSYSSNQEIEIPTQIVSGEITYNNYINTSSHSLLSHIFSYILKLLTMLICVYIIYLLISKSKPTYLDKLSNITALNLLKCFGIGLGILVLVPIISILLFMTYIGSVLGLILLLVYMLLLIIAKPIFIISVSTLLKNKLSPKLSTYLYILVVTVILSLISLIPYLGFIISALVLLIGLGIPVKRQK